VDPAEKLREFGQVFDDVATEYDEVRPSYPRVLLDAAMERGGLATGSPVVEVGCGTGKLTELLAVRGLVVDAVDPGPNMLEAARRRVGPTDDVRFHLGRFEDVSLPASAFAALFSAAAFHWLDPAVAWSKAATTLQPGGLLALIGIEDEHSDGAEDEFIALLGKHAPEVAATVPRPRDLATFTGGVEERRGNASEVWDWMMEGQHHLAVPDASDLFDDVDVTTEISVVEQTGAETAAHFRTTSLYFRIDPERRQAFEDDHLLLVEQRGGTVRFSIAAVLMTARRI
jgi:ubiquinone/menaquinone biosynthesis C-methylase UbiE